MGVFKRFILLNLMLGVLPVIVVSLLMAFPKLVNTDALQFVVRTFLLSLPVASITLAAVGSQAIQDTFDRLQYALRRIRTGDLAYRIPLEGPEDALNLFRGFNAMAEMNQENWASRLGAEKRKAIGKVASQVAHDIRSPLSALTLAEKHLNGLPEETRLNIRMAIRRISDIAAHLLETERDPNLITLADVSEPATSESMQSLIAGIVSENQLRFDDTAGRIEIQFRMDSRNHLLFAKVQPREFKRVLSNLIDNAVEAIQAKASSTGGKVRLSLHRSSDFILIRVKDNGHGIPSEILPTLGERGVTFGKARGSGLGLHHARVRCEGWGGRLKISSVLHTGTTVTLALPLVAPPSWYLDCLRLGPGRINVIVIDDDSGIHRVWKERLGPRSSYSAGISLVHLTSPNHLAEWRAQHADGLDSRSFYLMDHEFLSEQENGLDFIEKFNLAADAVLVTGRDEDPDIRERSLRLSVRVLPKRLACVVPISLDGIVSSDVKSQDSIPKESRPNPPV